MYDFTNLSDVEFEKLCSDVLSRKLGVKLRYFAPGRDGGIDLIDDTDNTEHNNIVVQVKHYSKSTFSSLLTSLKKEVNKVEKLKPKQYYICVSKELTKDNINQIYNLFMDYMKDTSNIITRDILVEFLDEPDNQDILKKNFKLWLLSDRLLKDIYNSEVFIDSEVLLDDINDSFKYFVQTDVFNEALELLKESRLIMLYGPPGVGKSINSKMLASAFTKNDYIIRYTSDSAVSKIKSVLSEDKDAKEVIFIDDCLGQYYFNLKEGQDRELISLINFIKKNKNKILILNTRVTILNEAKRTRLEFRKHILKENIPLKTIDMEDIRIEEKAEIFYNHLLKNKVPKNYFNSIAKNKNYRNIVQHKNYNPRIIEFVTEEYRFSQVKPQDYFKFIMQNLNNPKDVWADEFEHRLNEIDRIFMYTLFSLTDTFIDSTVLEECFIFRLNREGRGRSTINFFSEVKSRLTKSLIRIVDINGKEKVGVLNPSINDYMNGQISKNIIGQDSIRYSLLYVEQLERMYNNKEAKEILRSKLISGEFLQLKSIDNRHLNYILYGITKYQILNESYKPLVDESFYKINASMIFYDNKMYKKDIVISFLEDKVLYDFYNIKNSLTNEDFKDDLDYIEIVEVLLVINREGLNLPSLTNDLIEDFFDAIDAYLDVLDIDEYIEDINGFHLSYDFIDPESDVSLYHKAISGLLSEVKDLIAEEIFQHSMLLFDAEILDSEVSMLRIREIIADHITIDKIEDSFTAYFQNQEPDFDDFRDEIRDRGIDVKDADPIDVIFDREYVD